MTNRRAKHEYWRNESGAGATEFVLVLIPFAALIFGIINLCLMFYANHTLQYAVQSAARCYSVDFTACGGSAGTTQTYATTHYSGPNIGVTFTAMPYPTGCGHTVTGSGNFPLNAVVYTLSVPLAATACFP